MDRSAARSEYIDPGGNWVYRGLGDLDRDAKRRRNSEFSYGVGLRPEQLKNAPPHLGGRYRGTSPPSIRLPDTPRVTEHVWGYSTEPAPTRYPRSPYED